MNIEHHAHPGDPNLLHFIDAFNNIQHWAYQVNRNQSRGHMHGGKRA